jgi:hypothetical protein
MTDCLAIGQEHPATFPMGKGQALFGSKAEKHGARPGAGI